MELYNKTKNKVTFISLHSLIESTIAIAVLPLVQMPPMVESLNDVVEPMQTSEAPVIEKIGTFIFRIRLLP